MEDSAPNRAALLKDNPHSHLLATCLTRPRPRSRGWSRMLSALAIETAKFPRTSIRISIVMCHVCFMIKSGMQRAWQIRRSGRSGNNSPLTRSKRLLMPFERRNDRARGCKHSRFDDCGCTNGARVWTSCVDTHIAKYMLFYAVSSGLCVSWRCNHCCGRRLRSAMGKQQGKRQTTIIELPQLGTKLKARERFD